MRVVENKGMREALRLVRMHAVRNGMQIFWGAWRQITAACHVLRLGGLRAFLVAVVRRWGLFTRCARNRRVAGGLLGRLQWIFQAALGRSSLRKWARIASESVWLRRSVCRFVNRRVTIALRKILACWRSIVVVAARSRLIFTYLRGMVRRGILRGILFFWRQRIFLRRTCCSFNSKARRCMLRMTIRSWQKASSRVRTLLALELHAHRRCGLSCLIIWRLFCAVQRCAVANARTLKTSWLKWFRRVARQRVRMALALRFDRARARRLHQWVFIGFVQSKAFADRRRRNERMCSAREWESREGTRRAALIVWSAVVLVGQGPKAKASSSGKAELVEKVGEGGWGEAEKRMRQALVVASVALREASCRRKSPGMRHAKDGTRSFLEDPWHEQPMQTPPRSITS